LVLFLES